MISPTKKEIRGTDGFGSGSYGARRGDHIHKGVDYICIPGQMVVMPIAGVILREARPYANDSRWSGVLIKGKNAEIKMFYLSPDKTLFGQNLNEGAMIGIAQDISKKYPGITPHIHLEIVSINPEIVKDVLK